MNWLKALGIAGMIVCGLIFIANMWLGETKVAWGWGIAALWAFMHTLAVKRLLKIQRRRYANN